MNNFQWIIYLGNVTTFLFNFSVNNDFRNVFALCHCSNYIFCKKILSYIFLFYCMMMIFNGGDELFFAL